MNKKAIKILRASVNYDPATSEEVLADGQLFYSKKTKKLYIGDGESQLKDLKGTELGLDLETHDVKENDAQLHSTKINNVFEVADIKDSAGIETITMNASSDVPHSNQGLSFITQVVSNQKPDFDTASLNEITTALMVGYQDLDSSRISIIQPGFITLENLFLHTVLRPDGIQFCDGDLNHGILYSFDNADLTINDDIIVKTLATQDWVNENRENLNYTDNNEIDKLWL